MFPPTRWKQVAVETGIKKFNMYRKQPLATGEIYHIFNKSIAGFKIFNSQNHYARIMAAIRYYQIQKPPLKFTRFINLSQNEKDKIDKKLFNRTTNTDKSKLVRIVAYCIMPTHLHLILEQLEDEGISTYMNNLLNSYTRYFNTRQKRKGPLWQGRFKNVLVETDEQLLHLTRYLHLNPVTAYLIKKPEQWSASSYNEFLSNADGNSKISQYDDLLDINPKSYSEFVNDRVSYQRELKKIKDLIME